MYRNIVVQYNSPDIAYLCIVLIELVRSSVNVFSDLTRAAVSIGVSATTKRPYETEIKMSDTDKMMIDMAVETNPMAIAEAEGHLKKGLMILSQEIGLSATGNIVTGILGRLEGELPARRLH